VRVWVSGAAGKLGTEVCAQLSAAGHDVVAADACADGAAAVDLLDPAAVATSQRGADAIVHCAAIPSPENVSPAHLVENNTMSTFNALEEAWNAGIRLAVLASSGSIYGTAWAPDLLTQPYVPVDEDSRLQYVDPYALTKDLLERMGQLYARRGMTVTALRFHWIATTEELRRRAEGEPDEEGARMLWGYVHLQDAAGACVMALRPASEQREPFEALVIAAADTWVREPTERLLDRYFPDSERRAPLPGNRGAFDCSRAARVIGWVPQAHWRAG
jgi:nucleoside-diphosphate-sugar epimerase